MDILGTPTSGVHAQNVTTVSLAFETKQGPSTEDWYRVQPVIKRLYIGEKRSLKEVIKIMADNYGDKATEKMYKSRFTKWNLDKKNRQSDMAFLCRKKTARDAQGQGSTFMVRGMKVTAQEVDRYVQRKLAVDPTFEAAPADQPTPKHIQCSTPLDSPFPEAVPSASSLLGEEHGPSDHNRSTQVTQGKRKRAGEDPETHSELVAQGAYRRTRPWIQAHHVPRSVIPPEYLRRSEMLFTNISSYVRRSNGTGSWYMTSLGMYSNLKTTILPDEFTLLLGEVLGKFENKSGVRGRRLLSKAYTLLPTLLREESPGLLRVFLYNFLWQETIQSVAIAETTQKYIAELVKVILHPQHLLRQISVSLSEPSACHLDLLVQSWRCYTDTIADISGKLAREVVHNEIELVECTYMLTDPQRAEHDLRALLVSQAEAGLGFGWGAILTMESLAESLWRQRKTRDAVSLAEHYLEQARAAGHLAVRREGYLLGNLAKSQYMSFDDNMAEENMRRAISLSIAEYGTDDLEVRNSCFQLEQWLREWGRHDKASPQPRSVRSGCFPLVDRQLRTQSLPSQLEGAATKSGVMHRSVRTRLRTSYRLQLRVQPCRQKNKADKLRLGPVAPRGASSTSSSGLEVDGARKVRIRWRQASLQAIQQMKASGCDRSPSRLIRAAR